MFFFVLFFLLERLPLPAERQSPRSPVKIEKAPQTLLAAPTHLSSADKAFGSGDGGGQRQQRPAPGSRGPGEEKQHVSRRERQERKRARAE